MERIAIVGATATGKTQLALRMAAELDAEIVSGDSMCVYRGMDIGTAKPSADERRLCRHHLVDVVDPDFEFSLAEFAERARAAIVDIEARGKSVILVGGTGLYVDTIVGELTLPGQFPTVREELEANPNTELLHTQLKLLDPLAASRMEPNNRRRVVRALEVTIGSGRPFSSFGPGLESAQQQASTWRLIGLDTERDVLAQRIAARYELQMEQGFLAEVQALREQYGSRLSRTAGQALGYRQLLQHLAGECTLQEALADAQATTVRFSKRQQRWFRRNQRIEWRTVAA